MVMFNTWMRPEVIQPFWSALQAGQFISDAAESVGTYRVKGRRWILAESGIRPRRGRHLKGRCLTFTEREEIALGRARGESVRCIARQLGRAPSTVSRELARNTGDVGVDRDDLSVTVCDLPRRVAPRADCVFADRTQATSSRPRAAAHTGPRDMVNIAERPQEADDRALPGHWEGDLMIGKANKTAIGTLVERSTGYALLIHLPDGYKPEQVAPALAAKSQTLPDTLRRSLTWDQGAEMRD
jgi:IS30 family transposase